jgi:hypothetical protein
MIHIKDILAKTVENASKTKFYHHNREIFIKYFDSVQQYNALISAGNFEKMELIIKNKGE